MNQALEEDSLRRLHRSFGDSRYQEKVVEVPKVHVAEVTKQAHHDAIAEDHCALLLVAHPRR